MRFNEDVRLSERVVVAFFLYATALAFLLPAPPAVRLPIAGLNAGVIASYALLIPADRIRRWQPLGIARDWLPLLLALLAYREMGWFARPMAAHPLERWWVQLDRLVLRGGAHAAIEALGPVVPSILEIAYALVYAIGPFAVAMLYAYRRRERVDVFLFPFVLAVLLCYAQFPFWPSEPPRTVFPGEDFPSYITVFRRFNWWMLGGYGIHMSVFPSAHVAGAFSAAFGMGIALPERRWVGRMLLALAILIATATVYGRYHYLADATAGLGMAVLAAVIARTVAIWRTTVKKAPV